MPAADPLTLSRLSQTTSELNRLGEPHGIEFFDDWIPDLKAAYNLRVVGE
jgi:hypothetical protein